ncbi:unnamed protein product [Ceutorhynchus assimilis]|uniref:Uncharacterized protein n=1 Tax=Ceutorhynchus assimilis TaxID=467358 RepID=A0A9N9QS44_9CUCU|nr:unnamed protein product [Ceutorhynchus assimilis]
MAKKKKSIIRNHENATGGGPAIDIKLTTEEEKVIDILGPIVIEGDQKIPESSCSFVFDDHNYSIVEETLEEENIEDTSEYVEEDMAIDFVVGEEDTQKDEASNEVPCSKVIPLVTPKRRPFSEQKDNNFKAKKPVRVQRLQRSINANDQLVKLTEKKIKLKENNLSLYKRDVVAKENIASSLQQLCNFFINEKQ